MNTQIGYVVLYLNDTNEGAKFWNKYFNFVTKNSVSAGNHDVITVGSKDGQTNFELVPLAIMEENPYNINLGIPSICLLCDDIKLEHDRLKNLGAEVTAIEEFGDKISFAIIDNEGNAFAIAQR